ncbi:MAG: hypothetical protein ACTTKN_02850 [Phocaeicola sp.]
MRKLVLKSWEYVSPQCEIYDLELQGVVAASAKGVTFDDTWSEEDWQ